MGKGIQGLGVTSTVSYEQFLANQKSKSKYTPSTSQAKSMLSYPSSASWFPAVYAIFARKGVPETVWLPIMIAESSGKPSAGTKNQELVAGHNSAGLFQLNAHDGQGAGYSILQLINPLTNAQIASTYIAPAYQEGINKGLSGYSLTQYVAKNSGHLGLTSPYSNDLHKSWDALTSNSGFSGFRFGAPGISLSDAGGQVKPAGLPSVVSPLSSLDNMLKHLQKHYYMYLLIIVLVVLGGFLLYKGIIGNNKVTVQLKNKIGSD